jgi:iron(III) transport system ATP-binding protein
MQHSTQVRGLVVRSLPEVDAVMSAEGALAVTDLRKVYMDRREQVAAVDGVSFEVPEGRFYTLLGPSGCGKTTTLRCIAGLERPSQGQIVVDGQTVWAERPRTFIPPHKRNIGMVFQSYAIWPHMTVFENVAFPLRVGAGRTSKTEMKQLVEEALATVQLAGYEGRMATQLSGGQQQRLALARALVRRPRLLLLDEPLSNLDAKLREELRTEVRNLQRRLGITTLYVTHDQVEALSMSNTIAVMSQGKIVQESGPRTIYQRPTSRFVANFVGGTNFVDATVREVSPDGSHLEAPFGVVIAACPEGVRRDETVTLAIRPENIRLHANPTSGRNVFSGTVDSVTFLGEYLDCRVRIGQSLLFTREHPTSPLRAGDPVHVELPVELCAVLTEEHGVTSAGSLVDESEAAENEPEAVSA